MIKTKSPSTERQIQVTCKATDNRYIPDWVYVEAPRTVNPKPGLTLGYMTKTLNQIFFSLHQNQNMFSATLGIRIFF
jgi:ribosomal protein L39E